VREKDRKKECDRDNVCERERERERESKGCRNHFAVIGHLFLLTVHSGNKE
jgi:hypothetical protein